MGRKYQQIKLSKLTGALLLLSLCLRRPAKQVEAGSSRCVVAPRSDDLRLPLELVELVLGQLLDDKASLIACTTVCRAWLNFSRRYLFRKVTVTPRNGRKSFSDFLAFLQADAEFDMVRSYIHELQLGGMDGETTEKMPIYPFAGLQQEVFESIIASLPSLTSLKLIGVK